MKKVTFYLKTGCVLVLFLTFLVDRAAFSSENNTLLSIGAGISSPSFISTFYNPGGFTANTRTKLDLFSDFSNTSGSKNPQTFGGGVFLGNGKVGGGFQLSHVQSSQTTTLQPGVAFEISSLRTSFGVVCSMLTTTLSLSCNNFGLLFDPKKSFRFGAQVITSSVSPLVSAGISLELNKTLTFVFDGTQDFTNKTTTLVPGLGVDAQNFELMVSYTTVLKSASSGSALYGLGWHVSKNFKIAAYSNLINSLNTLLIIGL